MSKVVEFGQKIPESKFVRCFCTRCGVKMRTFPKELYNDHYCELCGPKNQGCSSPIERLSQDAKRRLC